MIFIVEIVNFISILTSTSMQDIVQDFMALAVISEFDDLFYGALGDDENKTFLEEASDFEDLFLITKTTSKHAKFQHEDHELNDVCYNRENSDEKVYIYIPFFERSPCNMLLRCLYLVYRTIYVSIWFYFLPFIALIGSYAVPYYLQNHMQICEANAIITKDITAIDEFSQS